MNGTQHRYLVAITAGILALAVILTGLAQAEKPEKEKAKPKPTAEKREQAKPRKPAAPPRPAPGRINPHREAQGEPHTFLGLAVTEISPAVRAHLDIPRGTGVSVGEILPNSPAAKAGLEAHDVLAKLDDQVLVNPQQFQALVRMKEPGDKVELTYFRGARKRTTTVALATHRFPVAHPGPRDVRVHPRGPQAPHHPREEVFDRERWNEHARQFEREMNERMRDWWHEHGDEIKERFHRALEEAFEGARELPPRFEKWLDEMERETMSRTHTEHRFDHRVNVKDDDHDITVTTKEGRKFVTALDKDGKEIFEGYCDTREERARVPREILEKIDRISVDARFHGPKEQRERHENALREHHERHENAVRERREIEERKERERREIKEREERSPRDRDAI